MPGNKVAGAPAAYGSKTHEFRNSLSPSALNDGSSLRPENPASYFPFEPCSDPSGSLEFFIKYMAHLEPALESLL